MSDAQTSQHGQPLVGLVMGSDSDWPVMELAARRSRSSASPTRPTSSRRTACPTR